MMTGDDPTALDLPLPATEDAVQRRAAACGLAVPAACLPGVRANLVLLERHAAVMLGTVAPEAG